MHPLGKLLRRPETFMYDNSNFLVCNGFKVVLTEKVDLSNRKHGVSYYNWVT